MGEVLGKISGPPHPFVLSSGPDGQLTLQLSAPITVHYSTGASDALPAHTPAVECPLDPAYIWCPYTIVGSGDLHAVKEADIGGLSGDYCILGHVQQHEVVPHQPSGGGLFGGPAVKVASDELITVEAGTNLVIPFNLTLFDHGTSAPQHDTTTNNTRLVCQQAGIYLITGIVGWFGPVDLGDFCLQVLYTPTYYAAHGWAPVLLARDTRYASYPGENYLPGHSVSAVHPLAVGDFLELSASNFSSSDERLDTESYRSSGGDDYDFIYSVPSFSMVRIA